MTRDIRGPRTPQERASSARENASRAEARAAELRVIGNEAHACDYDEMAVSFRRAARAHEGRV